MAFPHHGAEAAPTPRPGERARTRRLGKLALASLGALLLVAVQSLPAGASWPVATRNSYVSQWYSSRHRADDIAATRGARIVPARSGRVVFAGWRSNCGGYQVWVYHGGGTYTAYYHMSREVVYSGKSVTRQSTTLGYVGSSGCATGAHLHFEVWKGFPWRSGSYRINPWRNIDSGYYLPYRYR